MAAADIAVLVTALMAAAGIKIADRKAWMLGLSGIAILSSLSSLAKIGLDGAWQTGAKKIARTTAVCAQAKVYAASGWRLEDGSDSRAARREEPVFGLGYKLQGHAHGFTPEILVPGVKRIVPSGPCPILVWIEQVPARKKPTPAKVLAAVGLKGLDGARFTVIRTNSGLILSAER